MTTTKTLMLAGLAALSLGMGTAMAQEGGSFSPAGPDYWAVQNLARQQAANRLATQRPQAQNKFVNSGSSDRSSDLDAGMRAYNAYNPYAGGGN
jgi:hypothetical protein